MKLPWVSRELYELVLEELRRSEAERVVLLNHALGLTGRASEVLATEQAPDPDTEVPAFGAGANSIAAIRNAAQSAAFRRAGRLG